MKITKNIVFVVYAIVTVIAVTGCGGGGSSTPFFDVETVFSLNGMVKPDPHVGVDGTAITASLNDCTGNPGGATFFQGTTDGNAQSTISDAAVGGINCAWTINRGPSVNCPSPNPVGVTIPNVLNGSTINVPCNAATMFTAVPAGVNRTIPPSTITIDGQNISAAYGMPQITFYDVNQNAVLTVTAASVGGNGTSLVIAANQIAHLANGSYGAVVYVEQPNGAWDSVGGVGIYVFTSTLNPTPCLQINPRPNCSA